MKVLTVKATKSLLLVVLLLTLVVPGQAQDWNPITPPDSPTARFGHSMVGHPDGKIYLFGGENLNGELCNDVYAFMNSNWTPITPANPPTARSGHSMVTHPDGKIYLFGGQDVTGELCHDLYAFQNNSWMPITPAGAAPPARARHAMWSAGNSLYIAGGIAADGAQLKDTWRYDVASNSWQQMSDAPMAFSGVHAVHDKSRGETHVLGLRYMLTYGEGSDTWIQYDLPGLPGVRTDAAVAQNEYKAWLFGGRDAGGTVWNTVKEFNFNTSRWTPWLDTRMPVGLEKAAADVFDWHGPFTPTAQMAQDVALMGQATSTPRRAVLLFGGVTSAGVVTNTTYVYFPDLGVEDILVPGTGLTMTYTDTLGLATSVEVPPGAVSQAVGLSLTALDALTQPLPSALSFAGHAFVLEAHTLPNAWPSWQIIPGFVFSQPVTITLHYSDTDITGIDESALLLHYWDGSQWLDAAATCAPPSAYERHPDENWLSVPICHLSQFALLGERSAWTIYLPLVVKP